MVLGPRPIKLDEDVGVRGAVEDRRRDGWTSNGFEIKGFVRQRSAKCWAVMLGVILVLKLPSPFRPAVVDIREVVEHRSDQRDVALDMPASVMIFPIERP